VGRLRREIKYVYIPGEPPVPPIPPVCTTTTKTLQQLGSRVTSGGSGGYIVPVVGQYDDPLSPGGSTFGTTGYVAMRSPAPFELQNGTGSATIPGMFGGGSTGGTRTTTSGSSYTSRRVTTCRGGSPGVPGTPGEIDRQEAGPDWQASARSIEKRAGDTVASFLLRNTPAVAVGFSTNDTGPSFVDIKVGVLFKPGGQQSTIVPLVNGAEQPAVGNHTAGSLVALIRAGGKFKIQSGGETLYETTTTTEEPVYLDAMLYTSNDYVDEASFAEAELVSVSGSVGFAAGLSPAASVRGSVGFATKVGTLVDDVAAVQVLGNVGFVATAGAVTSSEVSVTGSVGFVGDLSAVVEYAEVVSSLPAFAMFAADGPRTRIVTELPSLQLVASAGGPDVSVSGADLAIPALGMNGIWYSGSSLEMQDAPLPSFQMMAAEDDYAAITGTLPPLRMYADDGYDLPGYALYAEDMRLLDIVATDPVLYASITEGIELDPTLSLTILVDGSYYDGLLLDPTLSPEMFLEAMIESGITLSSATQAPVDLLSQYAFDLDTGAATRYDGFEFGGFTFTGDATYAFKKDGIYKLRAGDDDGQPRNFMLDLGTTDFGTTAKKHIETAFIGLSTDGTVYLKLNADQRGERIYRVIQRDPLMRARVGRGITARQWHAKLEVVDGRSAELDGVEFHVAASARRWVK